MSNLSEAGQRVFDARYAGKDENGNINETFEQACERIAIAAVKSESIDKKTCYGEAFEKLLLEKILVPSTPIWANVGKSDRPWQPSACFVLDVEDSLESMYNTLHDTAMVFKTGGGTGYNFSKIRPKGDLVMSTKGRASGVVELIRLYNASANMVMQGGVRRGASKVDLDIDHPEIIDYIKCKLDGSITNFNLSVAITDDFMKAVHQDLLWDLKFNEKVYETVRAKELWGLLVKCAWECGDPGLTFIDQIKAGNPVPHVPMNTSNPCGEQPLAPGESCLLASINLAKIYSFSQLDYVTSMGIRFLDNIIDVAQYPIPFITERTRATRKVGLGFTGLADYLIIRGIAYDSEEGRMAAREVALQMADTAKSYSSGLAEERGNFPEWNGSIYEWTNTPMRNATRITIAPTGSVTAMAGCEGYGIEPIFGVAYTKSTNVAGDFIVYSDLFKKACIESGVDDETMAKVGRIGSCQGVEGVPKEIQDIFKGAQDISTENHLRMQAVVQEVIDNAVSKTINMPSDATTDDVDKAYKLAYNLGLKGMTIFRDGCKEAPVVVGQSKSDEPIEGIGSFIEGVVSFGEVLGRGEIVPRPKDTAGVTYRLNTGCGKLYLTVNRGESKDIIETFIATGSDGGCQIYTEATSRLISLAIRGGISVQEIIEQLNSTHSCPSYMTAKAKGKGVSPGKSCPSAIAKQLADILYKDPAAESNLVIKTYIPCEACGYEMRAAEGCLVCMNCGFSKC